jgi:hypothetical protein
VRYQLRYIPLLFCECKGKANILIAKVFCRKFAKILQVQKICLPLSPQKRNNGAIAQLVEQRTENPCVPGSIPGGTTFKRLQIW